MSNVPTNLIPSTITQLPEYLGDSTLGYLPYSLGGRTYKVQFANIAAVGAVPSTRVIATGNGLEGGGDLSQNRTISIIAHGVGYSQLDFTGVTAGTYGAADTIPVLTVDDTGRVTAVVDTPFVSANYVPSSRTITAGAGLTGGGQLNNNITIALNPSNATPQSLGAASAGTGTQAARDDHVHPAVDLTDTSETQGVLPLGRGGTGVALSPVVGAVIYADNDSLNQTVAGNVGQVLTSAGGLGAPYWQTITGTGTVTSVSVVTANGFAGTVVNPDTAAAITLTTTVTGLVKANGSALSAAVAGTDYVAPGAITTSGLTMATARLLGRTTASSGAVEEITVGTGLSLSVGSLTNTAPDQVVSLTGGTAISISGTYPSFTITNTAPDQIVSLTGAGTTVVTGTYPNFTITSNDQYTGTVTSVGLSGGTTGLSVSGTNPITTSGTFTLGGTLVVANGGTGATTLTGYVKGNGTSAFTASATIPASDISSGAALTKTDDTNVTLTLGGSPSTALLAATSLTLGWTGQLGVTRGGTGTGTAFTAGSIVFAGASGVYSQDNANLFWDDSNDRLGIGTTSPGYPLTVQANSGSGAIRLVGRSADSVSTLEFINSTQATTQAFIQSGSTPHLAFGTSTTERMRIDSSGNVGIGTSSPGNKLSVNGDASFGDSIFMGTGVSTGDCKIELGSNRSAAGNAYIDFHALAGQDYNGRLIRTSGANGSFEITNAGTGAMTFSTNNGERMRIDGSNGNVGIGTTSPGSKLDVVAQDAIRATGFQPFLTLRDSSDSNKGSRIQTASAITIFYNDTTGGGTYTERMRINSSGFVGIGTSAPQVGLHVSFADQSTNRVRLQNTGSGGGNFDIIGGLAGASNAGLSFFDVTNSATRMYIDSSGNVGIGTSAPASLLHVKRGSNATEVYPSGTWASRVINATDASGENGLVVGNRWAAPTSTVFEVGSIFGGGTGSWYSYYKVEGSGNSVWSSGGAEVMRLAGSNLGIGTSSPANLLEVRGAVTTTFSPNVYNTVLTGTSSATSGNAGCGISFRGYTTGTSGISDLAFISGIKENTTDTNYAGALIFGTRTNGSGGGSFERMRITSAGYLLVGTTTTLGGNTSNEFKTTTAGSWPLTLNANDRGLLIRQSAASSGIYAYFEYNGGTNNGQISWSGGTTSYTTTSDARVKKNIVDAPDAGALIDAIKVRSWDFKVDDMHWRYGMVAQELLPVAPEAVTVPEDEEMMMGVDYAKLVPMLIKEVQSLRARVAQLEGN